jgi:hypothetical protein
MTMSGGDLVADFAARVQALPPDAWLRMSGRVPELEGDRISALLARSGRLSDAIGDAVPAIPRLLSKPFMVLGQLAAEFRTPGSTSRRGRRTRGRSPLTPTQRRRAEVLLQLTELLDLKRSDHPGVVAAFQAIMVAMPMRERIAPGEFKRLYAFVEPEIPFESLKRDDGAP